MSFGTSVVGVPGPHQQLGQQAANGDEERPGAHGRVADLQVEDLFGSGVRAEAFQDRPEGRHDDRLGEGPRRVVRARPPALVGRLEHHGPGRNDPGRGGEATLRSRAATASSGVAASFSAAAAWPVSDWSVFSLSHFARSAGLAARSSSRLIVVWCAVRLRGLDRDRAALGHFEVEAHHRLVDRADLLDVEGAVAEPLAVEDEQVLEHAKDHSIGNTG